MYKNRPNSDLIFKAFLVKNICIFLPLVFSAAPSLGQLCHYKPEKSFIEVGEA